MSQNQWQNLTQDDIVEYAPEGAIYYLPTTEDLWGGYVKGVKGNYLFNNGSDGGEDWIHLDDDKVFEYEDDVVSLIKL
jgi:hypothetical protein